MLVNLSWLKNYVDVPADTKKLVEDLSLFGVNVERVIESGFSDPLVVVGEVVDAVQHPNADRLRFCHVRVDDGAPREIVCGAPNVASGQRVFVALPGARLPDGTKIRPSKIRGVRSEGMICSERELGLGDDTGGIMVLDDDLKIGTPIAEVLGDSETVIEIEVTPNRPDLLSHMGVAREVAARYELSLKPPAIKSVATSKNADFHVDIVDPADCPRYVGLRVSNVRVAPSPRWLSRAIESVGLNSVNNIVDATNYVMMELGQPLHAFDFQKLNGARIVIRRATDDERLVALDGKTYELDIDTIVVADDYQTVALAGIIGGEASAVHDDTTEILIESANFDARRVRRTRSRRGLATDASYRFERGVDKEACRLAAERAAALIAEVTGGQIGDIVDAYPAPRAEKTITIRKAQVRRILGAPVSMDDLEGSLQRLGFAVKEKADDHAVISVPSHRLDIAEEIDLIEEVGRVYGYDRIGTGWGFRCTTAATTDPLEEFVEGLCNHLVARGFTEVLPSSFTDGRELEDFDWAPDDERRNLIPIRNPLGSQHGFLRTSVVPGMLDIVRHNLDRGVRSIRGFQIGREFRAREGVDQLPEERRVLGIVMTKPGGKDFWYDVKESIDLLVIKRELEILLASFKVDLTDRVDYFFDKPTGQFSHRDGGKRIIEGGIVSDRAALRYDFEQPVWYATLNIEELYRFRVSSARAKALTEYPSSKRDLSLVTGNGVDFAQIEKVLVTAGGRLLESLQLFDVYRGDKVGKDLTAYGMRLMFRSAERTLTDTEVDQIIDKILTKLKTQLDVELRG